MRYATQLAVSLALMLVFCAQAARADTPVTVPYDDGVYKGTQTTTTTSYVSGNATVTETTVRIDAERRNCDGTADTLKKNTTTRVFTDRTTGLKTREQTTTHSIEAGPDGSRTYDQETTKEYDALGGYKGTDTVTEASRFPDGTSSDFKLTENQNRDASGKQTSGDMTQTRNGVRSHVTWDPATGYYKSDAGEPAPAPVVPMLPPKTPTACPPPALTFRIGTVLPTEDTLTQSRYNFGIGYTFASVPGSPAFGVDAGLRNFGNNALNVNVTTIGVSIEQDWGTRQTLHVSDVGTGVRIMFPTLIVGGSLDIGRTKVTFPQVPALSAQSQTGLAGSIFAGYIAPGGVGLDVEYVMSPSVGSIKSSGIVVNLLYRPWWFEPRPGP